MSTTTTTNLSHHHQHHPVHTDDGSIAGLVQDTRTAVVVVESLTLIVLWVMSLVGNLLVCLVIHRSRRIQSTTNYFVVSLALADLCLSLLCVPFVAARVMCGSWRVGQVLCRLVRFVQHAVPAAVVFVLTAICVDRFYTIIYPLSFKVTRGTAKRMIVGSWVIACVLSSLCFYFFDLVTVRINAGDSRQSLGVDSDISGQGVNQNTLGQGVSPVTLGQGVSSNTLGQSVSPFNNLSQDVSLLNNMSQNVSLLNNLSQGVSAVSLAQSSVSPHILGRTYVLEEVKEVVVCPMFVSAADWTGVTYVLLVVMLHWVLPVLAICALYGRIVRYIWTAGTLGIRAIQRTDNLVPRAKVKMVKMLLLVTGSSLLLLLPFYIVQLAYCLSPGRFMDRSVFVFAFWCMAATGASKPLLYLHYNPNFRRGCKEVFCMSAMRCYRSHTYAITSASALGKKNHVGVLSTTTITSPTTTSHSSYSNTTDRHTLAVYDSPLRAFNNRAWHVEKAAWPLNGPTPSTYV